MDEYLKRRRVLAERLPQNSIAVVSAAQEVLRNGDAHYRFRQNSDFYYLTGSSEPDGLLLVAAHESILFNLPRDPSQEQWTGQRLGQDGACSKLGMTEAYPLDKIADILPTLLVGKKTVYYSIGQDIIAHNHIFTALTLLKNLHRKGIHPPAMLGDLTPLLSEMRLFKSDFEISMLRKAAEISVEAHKRAMQSCLKSNYEYELEAELLYTFARLGCRSVAYDPIVASGENACVLHYTSNNMPLGDNDLILIDAGGEYSNYAADITRTFPRNGQFSPEQKAIYNLVLKAQKAGIEAIKPGLPWNAVQQIIIQVLTRGLCELGLLSGSVEDCIAHDAYRPFYMHNSGHWLGLDVHDCGAYKINNEWRPLEEGMVLTVEPGIYIQAGRADVDKKWWNIGVRIEDDILVTSTGYENLTAALPREVDEIEGIIRDYSKS